MSTPASGVEVGPSEPLAGEVAGEGVNPSVGDRRVHDAGSEAGEGARPEHLGRHPPPGGVVVGCPQEEAELADLRKLVEADREEGLREEAGRPRQEDRLPGQPVGDRGRCHD